MNNLQKIQNLAASVRDSLATLKPSSGLDDLDAIAKERSLLREKLDLLTDAESTERKKLEAEEAAAKAKQRQTLLLDIAKQTEAAATNYQELTDRATSMVSELVAVLAEREQVFSRQAVGLNAPEIRELLSQEEQSELLSKLDSSTVGVYPGNFGNNWREAVALTCADKANLRRDLYELVKTPAQYQDSPLAGARPLLAETARSLAASEPAQHTKAATVAATPAQPSGDRYQADLRAPGKVIDLNAE